MVTLPPPYWVYRSSVSALFSVSEPSPITQRVSLLMLIPPALRYNDKILPWALILLVIASWIDKSLGLLIGGFVPNMFETVTEYTPTIPEILVALGVYGLGGIIVSVLWKIAIDVKKENGSFALKNN